MLNITFINLILWWQIFIHHTLMIDFLFKYLMFHFCFLFSAIDWEFFTIGEQKYLVISNAQNTEDSREHDSVIYRWQGVDQFVPVHRMKLLPTADFEAFKIGQDIFLLYANPKSNVSQILKAKFIWRLNSEYGITSGLYKKRPKNKMQKKMANI